MFDIVKEVFKVGTQKIGFKKNFVILEQIGTFWKMKHL